MSAPTNNADLVSAANTSRERFRITSGQGSPLERTLAHSDVAAPAAPSVGVTHATGSGSGGTGLAMETEAPPAISPSAEMRTPDQLHLNRDEAAPGPTSTSERSAMIAESGDADARPVPRPCAYTDVRIADHGGSALAASAAPAAREPLDPRLVAVVAASVGARATSSSASEAPTESSTLRAGHVVLPSWRRSEADTERSMVASNTAPTPDGGWEENAKTFLTNYLPVPMPVVDTTPVGHWTPGLPKPKAQAAVKAAPAKAAPRPEWTADQWQGWQDPSWRKDADDYDRFPNWRSSQRHGP